MAEKLVIGGKFEEFVPVELVERGPGLFRIRSEFGAEHLNAAGMVHGGFIAALMDMAIAGGGAAGVNAGEGTYGITISITVNFVAPLGAGAAEAIAEVTGGGARTKFVDAKLRDAGGQVVATATGTVKVIDAPAG